MSLSPAQKKALYDARKAAGQCTKCGHGEGLTTALCADCADKKDRQRRRRTLLQRRARIDQQLAAMEVGA